MARARLTCCRNLRTVFLFPLLSTITFVLLYWLLNRPNRQDFEALKTRPGVWQAKSSACSCPGLKQPFCYQNPQDNSRTGKPFSCARSQDLVKLGFASSRQGFRNLKEPRVTFVTAAWARQWNALRVTLSSIKKHYAAHQIIIYNMGIEKMVLNILRNYANVRIRTPSLDAFPKRVRNKTIGAWKPFLLLDALQSYAQIVWFDHNIQWTSTKLYSNIFKKCTAVPCQTKYPVMLLGRSDRAENAKKLGLLPYFPSNNRALFHNWQFYNYSAIYLERKTEVIDHFLWWLVLCALDAECWRCKNNLGPISCEVYLGSIVLENYFETTGFRLSLSDTLDKQSGRPTQCNFLCASLSIAGILLAFLVLLALAFMIVLCAL